MSTELELRSGGALAVGNDQTRWAPEQRAALASAGVSEEVTEAELTVFLHECQRTGLDPFSRQIYLIGRNDKQAGRKVFKSQTGIDGYRVVAHRAARRDGVTLSYADTLWCGPDGVWREAWLWNENPPLAAKITVYRNGQPFPATATLYEYAEMWDNRLKGMWARMPANQLAKCAESLALRKAFPNDLAGIYTAEEMGQADNDQRPQQQAVAPPPAALTNVANSNVGQQIDEAETVEEPEGITDDQQKMLHALIGKKVGKLTDEQRHAALTAAAHRPISSAAELTKREASRIIDDLSKRPDLPKPEPEQDPQQYVGQEMVRQHEEARVDLSDASPAAVAEAQRLEGLPGDASVEDVLRDRIESAGDPNGVDRVLVEVGDAVVKRLITNVQRDVLVRAAGQRKDRLEADAGWSHQRLAEKTGAAA